MELKVTEAAKKLLLDLSDAGVFRLHIKGFG